MASIPRHRRHRLLVKGLAPAVTAMLIAGGAAFGAAAPSEAPTDAPDAGAMQSQAGQEAAQDAKPNRANTANKPAKARGPKAQVNGQGRALGRGNGNGNDHGHGKAVSAAARGETPPAGTCRNHGHWVSTVAKGLASCDDNPRPAADSDDADD